jgi:propionyl-CoA carboxylase beta chain
VAQKAELVEEYRTTFASPYRAAELGFVDAVIRPETTRRVLIESFATLENKRDENPPKKHGNIPL